MVQTPPTSTTSSSAGLEETFNFNESEQRHKYQRTFVKKDRLKTETTRLLEQFDVVTTHFGRVQLDDGVRLALLSVSAEWAEVRVDRKTLRAEVANLQKEVEAHKAKVVNLRTEVVNLRTEVVDLQKQMEAQKTEHQATLMKIQEEFDRRFDAIMRRMTGLAELMQLAQILQPAF